jgi:NADH:ubiquinone oxidoreductase subunit 5 (subunit L)/multisubunit Na+/H+ antiporter MnhA subunit
LPLGLSFLGVITALLSYAVPKNRLFIIKNINLGPFLFFIKLVYAKFGFDKFYNTIVCAKIILLLKNYLANFVIFTINILEENIRVNKFASQHKTKLNVINMVEIYIISSIMFISILYYCLF